MGPEREPRNLSLNRLQDERRQLNSPMCLSWRQRGGLDADEMLLGALGLASFEVVEDVFVADEQFLDERLDVHLFGNRAGLIRRRFGLTGAQTRPRGTLFFGATVGVFLGHF